jgi:hypothetical protein
MTCGQRVAAARHEQPRPWDVLFGHDHRVTTAYHKHPFAYFAIELQSELYPELQVRGGAVGAVGPKGVHGMAVKVHAQRMEGD